MALSTLAFEINDLENVLSECIHTISSAEFLIDRMDSFNSDILDSLRDLEFKIEQFELHLDETETISESYADFPPLHRAKLKELQASLTVANRSYQKNSHSLYRRQLRHQLLPPKRPRREEEDDALSHQASIIQRSLQRTRKTLIADLSITDVSLGHLAHGDELLHHIHDTNVTTGEDSVESRGIVSRLWRKEVITKVVSYGAFVLFLLVALWVFLHRVPILRWGVLWARTGFRGVVWFLAKIWPSKFGAAPMNQPNVTGVEFHAT